MWTIRIGLAIILPHPDLVDRQEEEGQEEEGQARQAQQGLRVEQPRCEKQKTYERNSF